MAALDTDGSFYLQLFIVICCQGIPGFCQIIILIDQSYIQTFWTGLAVVAVYADAFCCLGSKAADHSIVLFLRRGLENCKIIGTQPLCYCKNLKLINCEMVDTDLSFEKSQVDAVITTPVISIKNPLSGCIQVPEVGEIIRDDENSKCEIILTK